MRTPRAMTGIASQSCATALRSLPCAAAEQGCCTPLYLCWKQTKLWHLQVAAELCDFLSSTPQLNTAPQLLDAKPGNDQATCEPSHILVCNLFDFPDQQSQLQDNHYYTPTQLNLWHAESRCRISSIGISICVATT